MTAEIIDAANELAEIQREQAIAMHRLKHNTTSAMHCNECGDEIPELRRIAVPGCQTCTSCQEEIELRHKQKAC